MLEMKTLNGGGMPSHGPGPPIIGSVPSRSNMSGSVDSSDTFATCNTHPFLSQEELESNLYVNPFDNGKDDEAGDKGRSGIIMMMGNDPVIRPTTSCGVLKDISSGGPPPGSPWGSPTKKKRSDAGIVGEISTGGSSSTQASQPRERVTSPKTRRTRFQHAASEQVS